MARTDARGDSLDGSAIADVARFRLTADLVRDGAQPVRAAREQDAPPPVAREAARDRGADPAGAARYDRDALNTRIVSTLIATVSAIGSA